MSKIVENYSNALLKVSLEENTLEEDLANALSIKKVLSDKDIFDFLVYPSLPMEIKHELIDSFFENQEESNVKAFLHIVVNSHREDMILGMLDEYILNTNKELGNISARVVSAQRLDPKSLKKIEDILEQKFSKKIDITEEIDHSLIGGFFIFVDGLIYDASLRTKINHMKKELLKGDG